MYFEANKEHLGVGLRRFQGFFNEVALDKVKIEKKKQPKKVKMHQGKVEYQGKRLNLEPAQKVDLMNQFNREKAENSALTASTDMSYSHKNKL